MKTNQNVDKSREDNQSVALKEVAISFFDPRDVNGMFNTSSFVESVS
jgi:hypothetical protein